MVGQHHSQYSCIITCISICICTYTHCSCTLPLVVRVAFRHSLQLSTMVYPISPDLPRLTITPSSPRRKASTETGLPPSWEVRHSNSKNLPYYFNSATKESRWEPPAGTNPELIKQYMATHHSSSLGGGPGAVSSAAAGGCGSKAGKIRAAHLLIKHKDSRRPSSWKESTISRSKEEATEILRGHEKKIKSGEAKLGDLATSESDCSSARKKGDL